MNRLAIVMALIAATTSIKATAAIYKCKDASGNTTYSEQPCPGAAAEQRLETDDDVLRAFVTQLHAVATHRTTWDVAFIERALGVRLRQSEERDVIWYRFASVRPGFPVAGGGLRVPAYGGPSLELNMEPGRCISAEMVRRVFGMSDTGRLSYQLTSSTAYGPSGYTTHMDAALGYGQKKNCVQTFTLRQNYSGGRRR